MPIETDSDGTNDNDGPHCRNCHIGASNCNVCHSGGSYTATITAPVINKTSYASQSWAKMSATVAINGKCLDGGFSWPHRTLGANLLKDELYGVDFEGNLVSSGATRTANGFDPADYDPDGASAWAFGIWDTEDKNAGSIIPAVSTDTTGLATGDTVAENLDSVCIDCHGDATYYNTSPAFYTTAFAGTTSTPGAYGYMPSKGWDLLLRGLP